MRRKIRKIYIVLGGFVLILIIVLMLHYFLNFYYINEMKRSDIFLSIKDEIGENYSEKKNNPDLCYQSLGYYKYLMFRQNLYKMDKKGKIRKILNDVQNFLVIEDKIIYCTVMDMYGNKMCVCDLNGRHKEELCKNVDYFSVGGDNNLITAISHVQDWTLAQINIESKKLNILDTTYNVSVKIGCFYEDQFIGTDDYTLDAVNIKTGKTDTLAEFYGEKMAYARVTSIYVHKGILYYGLQALKDKDDTYTGLWKFDLSSRKSEKIIDGEVWDISFVGDKCFVNNEVIKI